MIETNDYAPPIFLFDEDVAAFDSIDSMVRYIEPWDVTDEMRAYDSTGRRLQVRASGVQRTRWTVGGGRTWIDFEASGDLAADELAELLRAYVARVGAERMGVQPAATLPLDELVAVVHRFTDTR